MPRKSEQSLASPHIFAWEDDPYSQSIPTPDPQEATLLELPAPVPNSERLPFHIKQLSASPMIPEIYLPGTLEFRYWNALASLDRCTRFWDPLLPDTTNWNAGESGVLPIDLDAGKEFNAYYSRKDGLQFFHDRIASKTIFSGESPNVLCHEMGHAILDAIRPELYDAAFHEAAAFHESFGDISAMLCSLELPSFAQAVYIETQGILYRSSRLSRLAEQLGWGIRKINPAAVEADCLRNAVNSFFYISPTQLPISGPATTLTSEPHSFSRVFTASFLEAFASMFALASEGTTEKTSLIQKTAKDAGRLIVQAILKAPIKANYFNQIARQMIAEDARLFRRKYHRALTSAFVRHGVISLEEAIESVPVHSGRIAMRGILEKESQSHGQFQASIEAKRYGLSLDIEASGIDAPRHSMSAVETNAAAREADAEIMQFVDSIFQLGKIELDKEHSLNRPVGRKTHTLQATPNATFRLNRIRFDCGFGAD